MPSLPFSPLLRSQIAGRVAAFERRGAAPSALVRAAVALAVVRDEDGTACFVLTRRADRPGRHSGQWALPGGRTDGSESPEETALRELGEEVGLHVAPEAVLGVLDDYETRSGFVITPVVVWVEPDMAFCPDPHEVAQAYRVPLAHLERAEVPMLWAIPESERPVIGVPLPELGTVIHAPTAAILFQLREVALAGRDTRVFHFEQPVFAWR